MVDEPSPWMRCRLGKNSLSVKRKPSEPCLKGTTHPLLALPALDETPSPRTGPVKRPTCCKCYATSKCFTAKQSRCECRAANRNCTDCASTCCSNGRPPRTDIRPPPSPAGTTTDIVVCPVVPSEAATEVDPTQQPSRTKKARTDDLLSLVVVADRADPPTPPNTPPESQESEIPSSPPDSRATTPENKDATPPVETTDQ